MEKNRINILCTRISQHAYNFKLFHVEASAEITNAITRSTLAFKDALDRYTN